MRCALFPALILCCIGVHTVPGFPTSRPRLSSLPRDDDIISGSDFLSIFIGTARQPTWSPLRAVDRASSTEIWGPVTTTEGTVLSSGLQTGNMFLGSDPRTEATVVGHDHQNTAIEVTSEAAVITDPLGEASGVVSDPETESTVTGSDSQSQATSISNDSEIEASVVGSDPQTEATMVVGDPEVQVTAAGSISQSEAIPISSDPDIEASVVGSDPQTEATVVVGDPEVEVTTAGNDSQSEATSISNDTEIEAFIVSSDPQTEATIGVGDPGDEAIVASTDSQSEAASTISDPGIVVSVIGSDPRREDTVVHNDSLSRVSMLSSGPRTEAVVVSSVTSSEASVVVVGPRSEATVFGSDPQAGTILNRSEPRSNAGQSSIGGLNDGTMGERDSSNPATEVNVEVSGSSLIGQDVLDSSRRRVVSVRVSSSVARALLSEKQVVASSVQRNQLSVEEARQIPIRLYDEPVGREPKNLQRGSGAPERDYGTPERDYGTPERNYGTPERSYGTPERNYGTPERSYGTPERDYGIPERSYGTPEMDHRTANRNYEVAPDHGIQNRKYEIHQNNYAVSNNGYRTSDTNYGSSESPGTKYGNREGGYASSQDEFVKLANVHEIESRKCGMNFKPCDVQRDHEYKAGMNTFEIRESDFAMKGQLEGPGLLMVRYGASQQQPSYKAPSDPSNKFGYVVEGRNFRRYRVEERTSDGFIVGEYGVVSHDGGNLRGVRYTADGTINPTLINDALASFLSL